MLSVITLVRNRNRLLNGLMMSLSTQRHRDFELIVVRAGGDEDPRTVTDDHHIASTVIDLEGVDDERIAYSSARNAGASAAAADHLLFVDADTLLGSTSIGAMTTALTCVDALCTGSLLYLPPGHPDIVDAGYDDLRTTARPHPARPDTPPGGWRLGDEHHLVWGLNMGIRRSTFERAGGFDEDYSGYAGEDTDLGRAVRHLGVRSAFVGGVEILHQHHDSFDPPVQQFRATLRNAERYATKWGAWPMDGWLDGFERMGLIERTAEGVDILRDPTDLEIEAARQTSAAPFRSESVLR